MNKHFSSQPLITLQDCSVFMQGRCVLRVDYFQIDPKSFWGIIGPNGGGKTTLLYLILGFLKPCTGQIQFFIDRESIGYVPQYSTVNPRVPMRVFDFILLGSQGHQIDAAQCVLKALDRVGLNAQKNYLIHELSGGQRQRLLVARSLMNHPKLLLLDEPTSNLDPQGRQEMYELFDSLRKDMTILLVSHDTGVISPYIDHLACVHQTMYIHEEPQIEHRDVERMYQDRVVLVHHDHQANQERDL